MKPYLLIYHLKHPSGDTQQCIINTSKQRRAVEIAEAQDRALEEEIERLQVAGT